MAAWTLLARRRRGRDACVLGIGAIVSQRLHVRVAMRAGLLRLQRGIRREDRCVSAARRALSLRLLQRLWAGWGLCAQLTRERLEIEDYHRSVRAVSATPPSRIPPRAIALTAACHCTYRRAARRCCALCHHSSPTLYGRPCSRMSAQAAHADKRSMVLCIQRLQSNAECCRLEARKEHCRQQLWRKVNGWLQDL